MPHLAIGIALSSLEPGSPFLWGSASLDDTDSEDVISRIPISTHQDHITTDLMTTLRRLNMAKDDPHSYMVIASPQYFTSEREGKEISAALREIDLESEGHFTTTPRVYNSFRPFSKQLGVDEAGRPKPFNNLALDVGPSTTYLSLGMSEYEEGIVSRDTIFDQHCSTNEVEILEGVKKAMAVLGEKPSTAGSTIQSVYICHSPSEPQPNNITTLVKSLVDTLLPSLLPPSTSYHTVDHPELRATQKALEEIYQSLHPPEILWCFPTIGQRVGLVLSDGSIRTVLEPNHSAFAAKEITLTTTSNCATIDFRAGGPNTRYPLEVIKLDNLRTGMYLRFIFKGIEGERAFSLSVTEALPSGEAGEILLKKEIDIRGELRGKRYTYAVLDANNDKELDEFARDYDALPV